MAVHISAKRLQLDRAKTVMVGAISGAAFVVMFSFVAARALLVQRSYQNKVIASQTKAVKQLKENIKSANQLALSYKTFVQQPTNIIGGSAKGNGPRDGDNAKIVLDALPSKYDFPAVATSLEKILLMHNAKIASISGIDEEIAQQSARQSMDQPVEIPFSIKLTSSYDADRVIVEVLQRSIRPIRIQSLQLAGKNSSLEMEVKAVTYYLPEVKLDFPTQVVK